MSDDLIIRNATLPDGRTRVSILARKGRIAEVGSVPAIEGAREIDAKGYLVSPPFVDAHFHMDATLSLGLPRLNESGTLLEGIALWGELKPQLRTLLHYHCGVATLRTRQLMMDLQAL